MDEKLIRDIYKDVPGRDLSSALEWDPVNGLDLNYQPKWAIPDKICITCAVVGGPIMRGRNPNQPYTTEEIRNSAIECIEAGTTSVHIHVRDESGFGLIADMKKIIKWMHEVIDPIREKYGKKVLIDGSECTRPNFEEEKIMISEDLSEIVPLNPPFSSRKLIQAEAYFLRQHGVKAAIAIYNDGDLSRAKEWLVDTDLVTRPLMFGLLPGYGVGGTPLINELYLGDYLVNTIRQIREMDPNAFISVPSAGRASSYLSAMAILMGLHLRIGMEDTYFLWPHKDDIIPSNVRTFTDMKTIAEILGRRIATADEHRAMVGIPIKKVTG